MENIYTIKRMENVTLKPVVRSATKFNDLLNKQAWFAGLYIASLFCLTVTGATVRWMLANL
jgi:hypothetical protein